jgi:3-deoxy-7-phosphoheptulonate synthase
LRVIFINEDLFLVGNMAKQKSDLILMAGPCAVESEDQIKRIAEAVAGCGCEYLRGGAFKPRTGAHDWTGHGEEALKWMRKAADSHGLKVVTEIMDQRDIPMFQRYNIELYQVGARNAQNQTLLYALGEAGVHVLLKNGMNSTMKEWLGSAGKIGDYSRVMMCARGKNNETDIARNGLDITILSYLANNGPCSVIFDPSHIAGKREYVFDITMGAISSGVHGVIVEVHDDPVAAWTDGRQSIVPGQLKALVSAAHEVRNNYLGIGKHRIRFARQKIPGHVDVYFKAEYSDDIGRFISADNVFPWQDEETGILMMRLPAGMLGKFRQEGYAIGEIIKYTGKQVDTFAQGVHIKLPTRQTVLPKGHGIKLSPYNIDAMAARGRPPAEFIGKRYELCHSYPGQVILDAYMTIQMGRVPELEKIPLIMYQKVKG